MKILLFILLFSMILNSCGESLCYESSRVKIDQEEITIMVHSQQNNEHPLKENKCNIIKEWLNRKSMPQFLKNYISLESGIRSINKKTHFNDTFIP